MRADDDAQAIEAVKQVEVELCALLVKGEWDEYAQHLTDDYVRIIGGTLQTKQEVLNEFRTSSTKTIEMTPEKMDVRVYGDTAVVVIELRTRNRNADGSVQEGRGRPTKVFVRRNGRWYLAQLTGTPLPQR